MATTEQDRRLIHDLADKCDVQFENLLMLLSRTNNTDQRAFLEQQYRFEQWTRYLGVFADPQASLDSRLDSAPDIRDLVLELLVVLERNIQHGTLPIC